MNEEKVRRLSAIMFAVSRAETPEEYANLRDACYVDAGISGDSLERTLFEDMMTVFLGKFAELDQKLKRVEPETETPMDDADVRMMLNEF